MVVGEGALLIIGVLYFTQEVKEGSAKFHPNVRGGGVSFL